MSFGRGLLDGSHRAMERNQAPQTMAPAWPLSDGEVNFFYWFIQGSIMNPETRWRLRDAWGFCQRHAWAHLAVETSFRRRFVLGPAILYEDLMERCLGAFAIRGPWQARRLAGRLRARAPCVMCEMGAYGAGRGIASRSLLEQGRSTDQLLAYALDTQAHWQDGVCGRCRGDRSELRCRPHLLVDSAAGRALDLPRHARWVADLHEHLQALSRSFVWEYRGSAGPADQAALFAAAGWLSGWRPLLALLD